MRVYQLLEMIKDAPKNAVVHFEKSEDLEGVTVIECGDNNWIEAPYKNGEVIITIAE